MVAKRWSIDDAERHLRDVLDQAVNDGPQEVTGDGEAFVIVSAEEWRRRLSETEPPSASQGHDEELADVLERMNTERWANVDLDEAESETRNPLAWVSDVSDEEFDAWSERLEKDRERRRTLYGSSSQRDTFSIRT